MATDATRQEVGRLVAALPSIISIDGLVFDIVLAAELKDGEAWGQYRGMTQEIKIVRDLPTPEKLAQVFFHELLHAVMYYRGVADSGKIVARDEEHLVDSLSVGLSAAFVYNPWLLPWLYDCLTWRNKDGDTRRLDKLLTRISPPEIRDNRSPKPFDTRDRTGALGKAQGGAEDGSGPEILGVGEAAASDKR